MPEERLIHNGEILSVEDIDPENIAAAMAKTISEQLSLAPPGTPMDIVTALLKLRSEKGHKLVWTRFDIHQLFALWTNKFEATRNARRG